MFSFNTLLLLSYFFSPSLKFFQNGFSNHTYYHITKILLQTQLKKNSNHIFPTLIRNTVHEKKNKQHSKKHLKNLHYRSVQIHTFGLQKTLQTN